MNARVLLTSLKKGLVRCVFWIGSLVAIVCVYNYASDVYERKTKGPNCRWNVIPNEENPHYSAQFCYLDSDTVWLKLYDASGQKLLAERIYWNIDLGRFYWESHALNYDTSTGDSISLPPTLLDRLLAALP
jgi:hypothetical protein